MRESRKVVIIGAGKVGMTYAYTLLQSGLARYMVLIDKDEKRLSGEIDDLNHGKFFVPPVEIKMGDYSDCKDADLVVIGAGASQKPGETRLDLLKKNSAICKDIVGNITKHTQDAVLLVVTNPVDVLTYVALKESGFDKRQVIGSGTVLDSARFRYLLSDCCGVDPRNVHAYILGEHGDSEIAAWSMVHLSGVPLSEVCKECPRRGTCNKKEEIFQQVKNSAYHIIESKGATYYAVSQAMLRITSAILRDEKSFLTVSSLLEGEYGIEDVCLSLPTITGSGGAERIVAPELTEEEEKGLKNSARVLKDSLKQLDL